MAMSKTAAAAAVMAGTAFVSLPQRSATAPSAPRALREARGATHQSQGGRAMLSTVGWAFQKWKLIFQAFFFVVFIL